MNIAVIIEAYMSYYRSRQDEDRWVADEVDALVDRDPESAWKIITALIEQAESDAALAYIAAGPLEDLLKKHGTEVIDRVEAESRNSERFRLALSGVWMRPGDPIFERWYAIMSEHGFAEGKREGL